MAKKIKLWFSGEDAQLAARFTKFMTKVLYAGALLTFAH